MRLLLVLPLLVLLVGCACAKRTDAWLEQGQLNGIVYNMDTGFYDATVDCTDGVRVVFQTTQEVAMYLAEHREEELVVYCRWRKCRQWRWLPEVSVSAVVATQPKCRPCWKLTEVFGC